jgi:PKD repeat protein
MAVTSYTRLLLLLALLGFSTHLHSQSMGNWTNTGPVNFPTNQSGQVHGIGRVSQIKFHPSNSQKVYAVSASGGVYVTNNNGSSWAPMAGTEVLPQTSASSICINYNNDQTIYLCLGDANYYSNNYGIYKSYNGGQSWTAANSTIGTNMAVEILMDPSDTNKLVAATRGGIYRTTNGGTSWTMVQSGTFRDMKAKPVAGSKTLYAATATTFHYSTDFGATWTAVTSGLSTIPSGNAGMRIAVTPADTSRLYLAAVSGSGVIFKSTSSGTSFTQMYNSSTQCLVCYDANMTSGAQRDYNFDINAHPTKADEIILIAHAIWRSTDGGSNWSKRTNWWNECHTDMHHIEWNPYNNNQIWNANDGGVWMSTDTLATLWAPRSDGLAATEIYHASQSPIIKELISIGTQDNGELYYNSSGWKTNRGGDWTYRSAIDYRSGGNVWYMETGNRRTLAPLGSDQAYNIPFAVVTGTFATNNARIGFVPKVITTAFLGKDSIYRSTNTGATSPTWTLLKASTGTIRDIVSCTADSNILYVAASPNILYRSDNALSTSPTWTTLTTPASISIAGSVATSRHNANVVFMSCGAAVYRSTDKGVTWTNITGSGLSALNIRRIIHDDYSTKQRLFVNAGAYLHYKDSTTTTWTNHSASAGLPTVANGTDLMIYNDGTSQSILRLATYGRGIWQCNIADNLPPVANFSVDNVSICLGDTARFTQSVNGTFTSLAWSFPGGNPSSSTAINPKVVYGAAGVYTVTLIATNAYGSDTMTKLAYINVSTGRKLQIAEGFQGASFPPAGWISQVGTAWAPTSAAGGFGTSSKSIYWDNFNVDANGAHDKLLLPRMDLSGVKNARLDFDLAYAPYSTVYPDSLQVRISTDCGQTWNTVYTKTGTALGTAPALTTSMFVPGSSQWRTDTLSLAAYIGSVVTISFENIGHFGQALYLDNINLRVSPHASFGADDTTICQGTQVNFSDSSLNASSWSWTFTGGTPATSTAQNPLVTYNTPGNYTVRLIAVNALGNDTLTRTAHIQVAASPVVNLGNDTVLCPGTVIGLNAGNAGSTYLFSNAATTQTTTISTTGSYNVRVTGSNGCIGRDTIIVFAGVNPVVSLGNDTSLCPGASLTLNAGNTGSSYLYSNSATTQSIVVSTAGSYSVGVTNSSGCTGRDTINIIAASNPSVNLGNDTTLCPAATITLNAGNTGSSYLYSNAATTQTTSVSSAGSYSVVVTNASGCIGRDTINIAAGTNPVVNLGNDTILCPGSSIILNAGNVGSSYLHSNSAVSQTTTIGSAGTYSVRVTNTSGCIGRDTIVLTAGTRPLVNLGNDTALCPGVTITLNAGNSGSSFLYSTGASTQTITVSAAGSYLVSVTNIQLCVGRDTIIITSAPNPIVKLGNDTAICPGNTLVLDAGNPGSTYLYNTGATTRTFSVVSPGTYSVAVTTAQKCKGSDTIAVRAGVVVMPTISVSGATLSTSASGKAYQWFLNGSPIVGATASSYKATKGGTYTLQLTSADGCIAMSAAYVYEAAAVESISALSGFELFPNPNTGVFTIAVVGGSAGAIKLKCYNMAGQLMRDESLATPGGKTSFALDWSYLPAGVYNIEVQDGVSTPLRGKLVIR